jgi:hypothetical protein
MYREHEKHYCRGDHSQCAIMMVMKAASFLSVPKDLYPNQTFRVDKILRDHRGKAMSLLRSPWLGCGRNSPDYPSAAGG